MTLKAIRYDLQADPTGVWAGILSQIQRNLVQLSPSCTTL